MNKLLLLLVLCVVSTLADIRGLNVRDMTRLNRVGAPYPSKSGVVFQGTQYLGTEFTSVTNLYLATTANNVVQLSHHDVVNHKHDSSPVFINDNTIVFLSDRSGSSQLWSMDINGENVHQISHLPMDVDSFHMSPSGDRIAFSATVNVKQPVGLQAAQSSGHIYTEMFVRHWDKWITDERSHIFTVPFVNGATVDDQFVDLMAGVMAESPVYPFHGAEDYSFSPDGKYVAIVTRLDAHDQSWQTNTEIYLVAAAGPGGAHNWKLMTPNHEWAYDSCPAFSPDGKTMAYLSTEKPQAESDRARVKLYDIATDTVRVLTDAWDRSIGYITYSSDGRYLYAIANDNARAKLWRISVETGEVKPLHETGVVNEIVPMATATGDKIFFTRSQFTSPNDVYAINVNDVIAKNDTTLVERWTNMNTAALDPITLVESVDFHFVGANNDIIQGYYFKPLNYTAGNKYPVVMYIHGGPENAFEDTWSYRWNPNTIASQGYGVVLVNFHGSDSFGQNFTDSIRGDWGGKPYKDVMLGLEYALKTWPYLDRNRVGAMGASYGGFMVYWLQSQTVGVFKALIAHDGCSDAEAWYGTTEELWFAEYEYLGKPWDAGSTYAKFSPSNYVNQGWQTPMLVIHGELDYRLPVSQGLNAFTILQRKGIDSKFLYFPDENHWVLKPANSVLWHDTVIDWLNTHV